MTQLGFFGGTGDLGKALALHLAKNYDKTLIGSREKSKAQSAVKELQSRMDGAAKDKLVPATNKEVAEQCDIIIATLPAKHAVQGIKEVAGHFRGKQLLISTVAPTPKVGEEYLPSFSKEENGGEDGGNGAISSSTSITKQMKESLALHSISVGTAFQTVPANALYNKKKEENSFEADVPVTSDDAQTYELIAGVVRQVKGLRPLYLGTLELSGVAEGLTSVLLNVGKHNHLPSPTIKFFPATPK